ncbi:MAG: HAD family hydrolase [Deltaproteobacteria bacterium]|nr:HAD family hydrolase [Deltaproteobacteria bacterium]
MRFKTIVFDCDGVILESMSIKDRIFSDLLSEHGPEAVEKFLDYHHRYVGISRFVKFDWFYREILDRPLGEEKKQELNHEFQRLGLAKLLESEFVPGALEVITAFHERLPLFVASGTPEEELRTIFDHRNLTRYFKGVFGSPAGKTEILSGLLRELNLTPTEMLMVGDGRTDMEAAEAVGALFYGRGQIFSQSRWPWGPDLTGLATYVLGEDAYNVSRK